jgi:hypothetical protein
MKLQQNSSIEEVQQCSEIQKVINSTWNQELSQQWKESNIANYLLKGWQNWLVINKKYRY